MPAGRPGSDDVRTGRGPFSLIDRSGKRPVLNPLRIAVKSGKDGVFREIAHHTNTPAQSRQDGPTARDAKAPKDRLRRPFPAQEQPPLWKLVVNRA